MILHVMIIDKFLAPFIDFVDKHFGRGEHKYVFINDKEYKYGLEKRHNIEFLNSDDEVFLVLKKYMYEAKKIILHGLWRDRVDQLLYDNQDLLKKCYWIMWGGDFYFPETKSTIRHAVIKKIRYYINGTKGDFEYIQNRYNAEGEYIFTNINYPSNVFIEKFPSKNNEYIKLNKINILAGNSALPTNNHEMIFKILREYKRQEINIIVPLSYGNEEYKKKVIEIGRELFNEKIVFIMDFMEYNNYLELLENVDIAIMGHEIQHATGNIIQLLGFGKKVYISNKSTLIDYFEDRNLIVYDINNFNLEKISSEIRRENKELVRKIFSQENLKISLESYLL